LRQVYRHPCNVLAYANIFSRLKTKLNLPTIVVRPPVAPKIYKKVYAFLDSALTAGTPRKQQKNGIAVRSEPSTPSKKRIQIVDGTPSRTSARTPQAKTPATARSSAKRKHGELERDHDLPAWVMPTVRQLCKAFKIPHAAPHVYVGVSSIARVIREQQAAATSTPARKRARRSTGTVALSTVLSEFEEAHIPALIVVVAFFARSHLLGAPEANDYVGQREKAIEIVNKSIPDDVKRDEDSTVAMIEALLREAENGWLDMEWYHNLPEPVSDPDEPDEEVDDETVGLVEDEERPVQSLEVPKRGFGSMMTDATDWLSEQRRAEYKRWRAGIMKRITQIERQGRSKGIEI
jgi:origin recognition complex subunit 6